MRVTSAFWVAAYIRRVFIEGGFAAVTRKGSDEAGAVFVIIDRLDGTVDLYCPAPQTAFDDDKPQDRRFTRLLAGVDRPQVTERIAREVRFDPDLWVVDVEDRQGRAFLDVDTE